MKTRMIRLVLCAVAFGATSARKAKLRLSGLLPGVQGFMVEDPLSKRTYLKNGQKVWTDADFEDGVSVELPPQERILLVLRNP